MQADVQRMNVGRKRGEYLVIFLTIAAVLKKEQANERKMPLK